MYAITILVHGEMENGTNPDFLFEDHEKALAFMETCLENNYVVQVGKLRIEKE